MSDDVIEDEGDAPTSHMTGRMTVIGRVSGRRFWTIEQKMAVLRDGFGPGGSRKLAMERHEITSGQLYSWRQQAMSGQLSGTPRHVSPPCFAEVALVEQLSAPPPLAALPMLTALKAESKIGIELPSGVKLSVDSDVDGEALARVLGIVRR